MWTSLGRGSLSSGTFLREGDRTEGDKGIEESGRIKFKGEECFVEEHTGHTKTTQHALVVWLLGSTAEAASGNEAVSAEPQTEFRFLLLRGLPAFQQEVMDPSRNGLLAGILPALVWELNRPACNH